jgi:arginine decarboxylase
MPNDIEESGMNGANGYVPNAFVPQRVFFTKGVGRHKEKLTSFEEALRNAGIARCNLVQVSSILPPGAKMMTREEGLRLLKAGQITFSVMARTESSEPHRLIAASVGLAVPGDVENYGYLSEHHAFGETATQAGDYAEDLAAQMLATTLGVPFDMNTAYDQRKDQYKIGGHIVKTSNVTQSAVGDKAGIWTTVVAAAVLL